MKARLLIVAVTALIAPWVCGLNAAPAAEPRSASSKPVLEKGMKAEAIIAAIGKPAEVTPMAAPDGKAEKWTYRRLLSKTVVQTATRVQELPAFIGVGTDGPSMIKTRTDPMYSLEHVAKYQVTTLLMFNGELVTARQWQEVRSEYE